MNPILLSTPFASSGDKNTIPESDAPQPQNATWEKGFPPITQTPISEGGVPPERGDFNGALNAITQNIVFQTQGGRYKFDPTYANKIGGYPVNAVLQLESGAEVINKTPNNTTNPNVDMTGWTAFNANKASDILDDSGLTQQQINDKLNLEVMSRLPVSRFCDTTGEVAADDGLVEAFAYAKEHNMLLVIDGLVKITKTVVQPQNTAVTCENGIVFCEDPSGLTNKTMWSIPNHGSGVLSSTRVGALILSTSKSLSTTPPDRDILGLHIECPKTMVGLVNTYGCQSGGVKTGDIGFEITFGTITCYATSWTSKDTWAVNLRAQDGIAGTICCVGYPNGVFVGGTNHVDFIHPWGLPATTNVEEYKNKQLLVGIEMSSNAHVNHCYIDTVDTSSYDTPATAREGVHVVFSGFNSSIGKVFMLAHRQTKPSKLKLFNFIGAQNSVDHLFIGDTTPVDTSKPNLYSKPIRQWQNHILSGNATYLCNTFTYKPADFMALGTATVTGTMTIFKLGTQELLMRVALNYTSGTIAGSRLEFTPPDGLGVLYMTGEIDYRTMLKTKANSVSRIGFDNPKIVPFRFLEETGAREYYKPDDMWAGSLSFTARFINGSEAY